VSSVLSYTCKTNGIGIGKFGIGIDKFDVELELELTKWN